MDGQTPMRRKEDRPERRFRKGMYILPSLFTTANIAAGYYAILQIIHATAAEPWHLDNAAKAIGFAVLFDGLDGRIARMTKTSSDFGRELDSLADRKSTRLNSSHQIISYAVFCLKKKQG